MGQGMLTKVMILFTRYRNYLFGYMNDFWAKQPFFLLCFGVALALWLLEVLLRGLPSLQSPPLSFLQGPQRMQQHKTMPTPIPMAMNKATRTHTNTMIHLLLKRHEVVFEPRLGPIFEKKIGVNLYCSSTHIQCSLIFHHNELFFM